MTMQHKVSELEGALLDAAVAKAEGHDLKGMASQGESGPDHKLYLRGEFGSYKQFSPSTEWAHGGPIIERERINIVDHAAYQGEFLKDAREQFAAFIGSPFQLSDIGGFDFYDTSKGPKPLTAAMRAYVSSKFGETVDLP
jgi:hypothetical protein